MKYKIEFDCLLPELVADCVSREHAQKLYDLFVHFQTRDALKITDTNKGRDRLYMFMCHWLESYENTGRWIDERKGK